MPNFNSLSELERYLNKKIAVALKNDVAETVKETMKKEIEDVVYSVYSPKMYERKMSQGGLTDEDNMEVTMLDDNTMRVENVRSDDGKNVAETVITGHGYNFGFEYAGVPRDFIQSTKDELESSGAHADALIRGLRKQGLDVKK